ncbi:uncharacterized protein DUF4239 [Rhodobacter aestuarii]|uniref:DUF4239 domain-containing protein n=1 Tax=Rhodobacter aestuarii TaxID=453582 RepID=A0A1N7IZ35_9RHOB|nr:DUF4239 domain-containing protein [Rhodobacter aestuarii]PTV97364.1 uncharacterized protein DUF4239 [Rhodobacter aestuarii]SIS42330.1 Protein of unknown function [Rhodobacter aestuarii]
MGFDFFLAGFGLMAGPVFVLATVILALACYGVTRFLLGRNLDLDHRDLANSVTFRIAALHGMMLAIVFATELNNIQKTYAATEREAAMVSDVYYDLRRYDAEATQALRQRLAQYAHRVVTEEWATLAQDKTLSLEAWHDWERSYEAVLALDPKTEVQRSLKPILLSHVREISTLRQQREAAVREKLDSMFFIAAVVGLVMMATTYFHFPPNRLNLLLISAFAAYTGLITFFVLALSNPYISPGYVAPAAFQTILDGGMSKALDQIEATASPTQ